MSTSVSNRRFVRIALCFLSGCRALCRNMELIQAQAPEALLLGLLLSYALRHDAPHWSHLCPAAGSSISTVKQLHTGQALSRYSGIILGSIQGSLHCVQTVTGPLSSFVQTAYLHSHPGTKITLFLITSPLKTEFPGNGIAL